MCAGSGAAMGEEFDELGEDFVAVAAGEGEGGLGHEQAVLHVEIVAAAFDFEGEIPFVDGEVGQGGGEGGFLAGRGGEAGVEDVHDARGEDVHSEKAEVMPGAQAGNDEPLLGFGGRGFLDHVLDRVDAGAPAVQAPADGAVVGELAFVGGLDGGDGAGFGGGEGGELLETGFGPGTDVEMVADQQRERVAAGERRGAGDGVAVAEGLGLLDEVQASGVRARGLAVEAVVAGGNDDGDFLDAAGEDFLEDDGEGGFGTAIAVHERLEGKPPLVVAGGGDDGFAEVHGGEHGGNRGGREARGAVGIFHHPNPSDPGKGRTGLPRPVRVARMRGRSCHPQKKVGIPRRKGYPVGPNPMKAYLGLVTILLASAALAGPDICDLLGQKGLPAKRWQVQPLIGHPLRDPSICRGPDGMYYLTGTDGTSISGDGVDFDNNDGIRIWKSGDLRDWELAGKVFDIGLPVMKHPDDSPGGRQGWRRRPVAKPGMADAPVVRGVQAPEIHYLRDTFWIAYSMGGLDTALLKSASGKAEGPYVEWSVMDLGAMHGGSGSATRMTFKGGSPSLFADDDGSVYWLYGSGSIAKLKEDLTGFAEGPRKLLCHNPDKAMDYPLEVGAGGYHLTKHKGKYYLFAADFVTRAGESCEDVYVAWSDNVYGPYSERRWSIPHCGQTTVFTGTDGNLWATYCGNDPHAAFRDRAGIVPLGFTRSDHPTTVRADADFPRKLQAVNTERYPWHRLFPVTDYPMRDVQACLGPDGAVYYTGSHVGNLGKEGKLYLFKSTDMVNWTPTVIWDWDRQAKLFAEPFADPRKTDKAGIFSFMDTEVWFLNGTFYVGYAVYGSKPGMYLLRSTTGKAEGPYEFATNEIICQPSYFKDDDGKVYYSANSQNAPWKPDMSGPIKPGWGQNPAWPSDGSSNIGDCSGQTAKILGKYAHFTTGQDGFGKVANSTSELGCYTWNYMTADHIEGPWSRERVIGTHLGHSGIFQDRHGNWWNAFFGCEGSPGMPSWGSSLPGAAPLEVKMENGELIIAISETFPDYTEKALQERWQREGGSKTAPAAK